MSLTTFFKPKPTPEKPQLEPEMDGGPVPQILDFTEVPAAVPVSAPADAPMESCEAAAAHEEAPSNSNENGAKPETPKLAAPEVETSTDQVSEAHPFSVTVKNPLLSSLHPSRISLTAVYRWPLRTSGAPVCPSSSPCRPSGSRSSCRTGLISKKRPPRPAKKLRTTRALKQ